MAEEIGASGVLVGMIGAVPPGNIGTLCHLAIHYDYRKVGLGGALTSCAISRLHPRDTGTVRLDSTLKAKRLYRSLNFEPVSW